MATTLVGVTRTTISGETDVVSASYKLVIGLSVAIPEAHVGAVTELLSSYPPRSIETAPRDATNAEPGEAELHLVFDVWNRPPSDDRIQSLREGVLLATTSSVVNALSRAQIPFRLLAWGCTDPQRDRD